MTTGQSQIQLRAGNALDSDGVSNVATNAADFERVSVDNKDIYPNTVWTKHLFAEDGIFAGLLKAGSILVGPGGVAITSDSAGGEPTTGIYIGASVIELKLAGVATVTLDGTTGIITATKFNLTTDSDSVIRTAASGARVELTDAGVNVYNASGDIKTTLATSGLDIKNEGQDSPTEPEQISFKDGTGNVEGYIYYNHTAHKLSLVNTPGAGAITGYLTITDATSVLNSAGNTSVAYGDTSGKEFGVYRGAARQLWMDQTPDLWWDKAGSEDLKLNFECDFGTADITTGGTYEDGLAISWQRTHGVAPSAVVASAFRVASNGSKYVNVGVYSSSTTGCVVDWMTVDGSTQSSATKIHAIGIWL
jgi:hypothetical protein